MRTALKKAIQSVLEFPMTKKETRPDTQPSVADGWAGADVRVFSLFDSMVTDGPTDGWTKRVRN